MSDNLISAFATVLNKYKIKATFRDPIRMNRGILITLPSDPEVALTSVHNVFRLAIETVLAVNLNLDRLDIVDEVGERCLLASFTLRDNLNPKIIEMCKQPDFSTHFASKFACEVTKQAINQKNIMFSSMKHGNANDRTELEQILNDLDVHLKNGTLEPMDYLIQVNRATTTMLSNPSNRPIGR